MPSVALRMPMPKEETGEEKEGRIRLFLREEGSWEESSSLGGEEDQVWPSNASSGLVSRLHHRPPFSSLCSSSAFGLKIRIYAGDSQRGSRTTQPLEIMILSSLNLASCVIPRLLCSFFPLLTLPLFSFHSPTLVVPQKLVLYGQQTLFHF